MYSLVIYSVDQFGNRVEELTKIMCDTLECIYEYTMRFSYESDIINALNNGLRADRYNKKLFIIDEDGNAKPIITKFDMFFYNNVTDVMKYQKFLEELRQLGISVADHSIENIAKIIVKAKQKLALDGNSFIDIKKLSRIYKGHKAKQGGIIEENQDVSQIDGDVLYSLENGGLEEVYRLYSLEQLEHTSTGVQKILGLR